MTIGIDCSCGTRTELSQALTAYPQKLYDKNYFLREIWQTTKILVLENFRLYSMYTYYINLWEVPYIKEIYVHNN